MCESKQKTMGWWTHFVFCVILLSTKCSLIESKNQSVIHARIDNRDTKLVYRTWLRSSDLVEIGEWYIPDGTNDCTPEDASQIIINEYTDNSKFPPHIFNHYPETIDFQMTHNHLKSIELGDLSNATELRTLNVSHNEISAIAAFAFESAPKLTEIDLSFNSMSVLNENLFTSYLIKYLYLHNNQLNRVDPLWFENLLYLRILTLNYNQIHTIDWFMLSFWPNLNALHLNGNEINEIENSQQETVELAAMVPRSMQTLTIHDNPVAVQSHEMMWLNVDMVDVSNTGAEQCWITDRMTVVTATHNAIREIRLDLLMQPNANSIVTLNLANNRLESIENVTHFHRLHYLDVAYNSIDHIDSAVFTNLNELQHLNLANNQLKRFLIGTEVARLPNLNFLNVSNNGMQTLQLGGVMSQLKTLHLHGNELLATDSILKQTLHHEAQCSADNVIECCMPPSGSDGQDANRIITIPFKSSGFDTDAETHLSDEILDVIYGQFHIMEKNILELIDSKFGDIDQRLTRLEEEMIRVTADRG